MDVFYVERSFYLFVFSLMNVFIYVSWFLLAFATLAPNFKKVIIKIIYYVGTFF